MRRMYRLTLFVSILLNIISCGSMTRSDSISLQGVKWKLVRINGVSFQIKSQPTLRFKKKRAAGLAGCNHYFSPYRITAGGGIHFDSIAKTKMFCRNSEVRHIENQLLSGLRMAKSFKIKQGELIIKSPSMVLHFKK